MRWEIHLPGPRGVAAAVDEDADGREVAPACGFGAAGRHVDVEFLGFVVAVDVGCGVDGGKGGAVEDWGDEEPVGGEEDVGDFDGGDEGEGVHCEGGGVVGGWRGELGWQI